MAADLPNEMECLELEDVASLLGVSERMVRNYINDNDLPCSGDGRGRRFIWSDMREWYVQYRIELSGSRGSGRLGAETISTSETFDEAQLRKIKGEADLIELKLARERRQVVAIVDAQNAMAKIANSLRTQILAMPSKLTGQLFGVKERERIRSILEREADAQCRRLAILGTADSVPEKGAADE